MASTSGASSVRHIGTNEEEDDSDTTTYRYVPRTLLQGGPFYATADEGRIGGSSGANINSNRDRNRRRSTDDKLGLNRTKSLNLTPSKSDNGRSLADNFMGPPLNMTATDVYDDMTGRGESNLKTSEEGTTEHQPRHLNLEDIDIESIHGKDHYGKLEATPVADHQDKLWTEIDALDDVKKLASSENMYEGFPSDFEEQLEKLRSAHSHLLKTMRERDVLLESGRNSESTVAKGMSNNVSRVVTQATGANSHEFTIGPSGTPSMGVGPGGPGLGEGSSTIATEGEGAGAGTGADASAVSGNQSRSTVPKRGKPPSLIQVDEDRYVQEITRIIKQLRT
ncbi:uncharacterized protein ZBAI_04556 [Zygosaccharomyces bailii ISA1307]|nr:uncharacterized protein ZBAI_04556 [Zygosaccharomyces bailii ISA1307]